MLSDTEVDKVDILHNCIYALDNPEVFADVPGYISINISNW